MKQFEKVAIQIFDSELINWELGQFNFYNRFLLTMTQSPLLSDQKQLINALVLCLNSLISQSQGVQGQQSIFDIKNKPTISFPNYLTRIVSFMGCSLSAYIYSLILIDKTQQENPGFKITQKNIHRLLFTSIVVAAKFVDDKFYNNSYYAKVGGISLQTLNQQEQKLLVLLNYHCPIYEDLFDKYLERMERFNSSVIAEEEKTEDVSSPMTTASVEQPKQKRRQVRQKRQRSREKHIDRNYQTQESRQIDSF